MRLFLIGLAMGLADLMPGISGGTVAFIMGIYEPLLNSIKTLSSHSFRKIAWPFLLPLGGGIVTAILVFSKMVYFLLHAYPAPLLGFICGLIAASALMLARRAELKRPPNGVALILGIALSYGLTTLTGQNLFGTHFLWVVLAGMLGVGGMLLPGISGSYILQLIGVYPLVISALNTPFAPDSLKLMSALSVGIAVGFIFFSRLISLLLKHFYPITLATLVGFMIGGLPSLWPYEKGGAFLGPSLCICLGFCVVILLEITRNRFSTSLGPL